jgi:hypothetical protein
MNTVEQDIAAMQNGNGAADQKTRLAFLGYSEFDTGYRGGILVTDHWGKPLEFRCTAPVHPNPVQRTLYGGTLLPHIAVELIGAPLLRIVQEKPEVVIIHDEIFFDVRRHSEVAVVRLRRQGEEVTVSDSSDPAKAKPTVMDSPSGKFQPIVMEAHREFAEDSVACCERLIELFGRWDLIEPFDRLTKALEYVHQQKVLES